MKLRVLHEDVARHDAEVFDDVGSVTARAARELAGRGYPVLPCVAHGKAAITKHGLKDATDDERTVQEWFHKWPTANVAIRTGDRFDVLDVDGDEGLDQLSELAGGDDVIIPCGPVAHTPSGGVHLYFTPTQLGNRTRLAPGLDWRGAGGYVLVPPSLGPIGTTYEWHEEQGEAFDLGRPLVAAPGWLRALVEPEHEHVDHHPRARRSRFWSEFQAEKSPKYAAAALDDELTMVATAAAGTRNHTLNTAALKLGQLVGADLLDADDVAHGLLAAARDCGLGDVEARRTISSGMNAGIVQPRGAS